tara:strand:+ start:241 stop:567 length:327 start_codon:yes stop_codon:yes gene_type:complete
MQSTNFNNLLRRIGNYFSLSLIGSWKKRSVGIIFLLLGFYIGSNFTVYFLEQIRRPFIVLIMLMIIEILVRFRSRLTNASLPLKWIAVDNLRIGCVYSVVLEAFKLGS